MTKNTSLFLLSLFIIGTLTACSSTPNRYAFWADDIGNIHDKNAPAPNLADIPNRNTPKTHSEEFAEMRQRLLSDTNIESDTNPYEESVIYEDYQSSHTANKPVPYSTDHSGFISNSIEINYDTLSNDPYIYGHSPVTLHHTEALNHHDNSYDTEIAILLSQNPSITINSLTDFASKAYIPYKSYKSRKNKNKTKRGELSFAHGSDQLSPSDREYIKNLVDSLKSDFTPIYIIGHASKRVAVNDPYQAKIVNLKMSEKRAINVYNQFVQHGIAADRLNLMAKGDTMAQKKGDQKIDKDEYRRVEILSRND